MKEVIVTGSAGGMESVRNSFGGCVLKTETK
jgi:hypothetical protein